MSKKSPKKPDIQEKKEEPSTSSSQASTSSASTSDSIRVSSSQEGQKDPKGLAIIQKIDNGIGLFEQAFLVLALFSLIGVGTYQFVAGNLFDVHSTWPFEALQYLVFATAMGGAALSAQKGQMITMDFIARKLPAKARVFLRLATSLVVVLACYILYKGGLRAAAATTAEEYEVIAASKAYMVLPIGAALIAIHYILHGISDVLYLTAGQIPPEEEGPQAH